MKNVIKQTTDTIKEVDSKTSKEFQGIVIESQNVAEGYSVSALTENDRTITVIAKGVGSALENLEAEVSRLELEASVISALAPNAINLRKATEGAKVEAEKLVPSVVAAARAVLSEKQMEKLGNAAAEALTDEQKKE